MKLTSLSVLFAIIICPFLFITAQQSKLAQEDVKLRNYYDTVIDNAVQDAAFLLSQKAEELSYNRSVNIAAAKDIAVTGFFDSLKYAFNAQGNTVLMARVEACVPVLVLLENEGYSLYGLKDYRTQNGYTEVRHIWFPKQHYIGVPLLSRYSIRYTLEDKVFLYDQLNQAHYEGDYEAFKEQIPFFKDRQGFEDLRLAAVISSVEDDLKAYLEQYNQWAYGRSLSVHFDFPRIDDADWIRALTDEGLLVFAQGFPILQGKHYQHYALGGARIIRKPLLVGYTYDALPHYCRHDCSFYQREVLKDPVYNDANVIYFSTAYEAAKKGYYPCAYCRP